MKELKLKSVQPMLTKYVVPKCQEKREIIRLFNFNANVNIILFYTESKLSIVMGNVTFVTTI